MLSDGRDSQWEAASRARALPGDEARGGQGLGNGHGGAGQARGTGHAPSAANRHRARRRRRHVCNSPEPMRRAGGGAVHPSPAAPRNPPPPGLPGALSAL